MNYQIAKMNWMRKESYKKSNRENEIRKINLKQIC